MPQLALASGIVLFYRSRYREVLSFFLYNGFERLGAYDFKPRRFLERVYFKGEDNPSQSICCAGFELNAWRCAPFADHLMEWLPEYALPEEELRVNHGNIYVKLKQAAIRVYSSPKYKRRGEAGEIALHAVCRDYFGTLPISPRVFYKSTSNDVVKAFDLVHARIPSTNYSLFLAEMPRWFKPEVLKNLDEQGVPIQIAERFYSSNDTLETLSRHLIELANSNGDSLTDFEKRWLREALLF